MPLFETMRRRYQWGQAGQQPAGYRVDGSAWLVDLDHVDGALPIPAHDVSENREWHDSATKRARAPRQRQRFAADDIDLVTEPP